MRNAEVAVIGAGLAGCEAAWQLCKRGVSVELFDIKPGAFTPAHKSPGLAELVCSNSLRAANIENAVGLLKEEMRRLGSLIMSAADSTRVPAGGALAVDREGFSRFITEAMLSEKNIEFKSAEITKIDTERPTIVATGPLTTKGLADFTARLVGEPNLSFFDAAAPIVAFDSIDKEKTFFASRYDKGEADYINCPMSKEEYEAFYEALINAETAELHDFEDGKVFEGCMPIETMARRGRDTIRYGPLKPVGLKDPRTGKEPYAVVQLRKDNSRGTLYNIVGFQTRLKFSEQRRVFGMIPGLHSAEFERYGVMHRNTFIHSPGRLNENYQCIKHPSVFFAGQITGVEGYIESAASGLVCGIQMHRRLSGLEPVRFTDITAIGALGHYISDESVKAFQPMNISFGIMAPPDFKFRGKKDKKEKLAKRSLERIEELIKEL